MSERSRDAEACPEEGLDFRGAESIRDRWAERTFRLETPRTELRL
jgi:hypothetical protein